MEYALVRPPSDAFRRAIVASSSGPAPDPDRARIQHAAYVAALRALGVAVLALPAEPDQPDACFVEDQAVLCAGLALITRCGHPARRAEAEEVARALAARLPTMRMEAPATLDGGDVLQVGQIVFVGHSRRTNEAGIEWLREAVASRGIAVRAVPVPEGVLHLKSACSGLDERTVLLDASALPPDVLAGVPQRIEVPPEEAYAANAVAVGRDVLVAEGYPKTRRLLEEAGYRAHPLAMDAFRAADGALTCLSLRW